ncbi:MAG: hypothetical protein R3C15_10820 [Thermoleophilia bacterium]
MARLARIALTLGLVAALLTAAAPALAEQAGSGARGYQGGQLDTGDAHSCAILDTGAVRCWGLGGSGRLGYGATSAIGDDETPASVGPVDLGPGRTATAITVGGLHTCATLDNGTVRCWDRALEGQLGYGSTTTIGDDETPASVGPVSLAGALVATVADLSLTIARSLDTVQVGNDVTLTLTLRNDGPDPSQNPLLHVHTTGEPTTSTATSAGTFDTTTGAWAPGNLAPSEDDHATAAVTVTSPPPTPPAPPPPAAPAKTKPNRLTLALTPTRDTTAPHAFTATGRLVATAVADATACKGTVTVTARAGTRTLTARKPKLRLRDGACEYTARLTITRKARRTARTARITATFSGNDTLTTATAKARTARLA